MPSMSDQWESGHWVAASRDNALVIIGVSSRLTRREDEIAAAKNDAARKVAMFHGMRGSVESFHRAGAGFFDHIFDSRISLEHTVDYAQFIEVLQFDPDRDVLVHDGGTLVRFRYAVRVVPMNLVSTMDANGRPNWLGNHSLPEVEGYTVAVGVSRNQRWLRDTVMRSAQAAAGRIIQDMSTRMQTAQVETAGHGTVGYINTRSKGFLDNFRVLEFWINPENGYVYTLGIARFID